MSLTWKEQFACRLTEYEVQTPAYPLDVHPTSLIAIFDTFFLLYLKTFFSSAQILINDDNNNEVR
jgi:hypothetical protein